MELCKDLVAYQNLGSEEYCPCNKQAKYKVSFIEGTRGKLIERNVCGLHLNSLKKTSERLIKRLKFDIELKYEPLNAP